MRLAVFTSQFPSKVSTFFARDVRGLIAAGMDVDVFPLYPIDAALWSHVPAILPESILPRDRVHSGRPAGAGGKRLGLAGTARLAGEALHACGASILAGPASVIKSAYAVAMARAWARERWGPFDHILAYWGNYAATAAIAFQRVAYPTIPFSMFLHAGTDLYRRAPGLRRKLLVADRIIVVCDFNRRYVETRYPDLAARLAGKIHVHHPGLDIAGMPFLSDGRPTDLVLAVGSFERAKGFDDLLRAVALLRESGRTVNVSLVGDGPRAAALRRLAERLGLSSSVRFRGWLPAHEVQKVMGEATVLVHPSIGLGDAVPTVIKEAMAVGTPVVASAVAGIPELLDGGRCGELVSPRDVEALARAIAGLLDDPDRRARLARAGRAFAAERFDLWRNGQRLAEILRSTRRGAPSEAA